MSGKKQSLRGHLSVALGDDLRGKFAAWCVAHQTTPSRQIKLMTQELCGHIERAALAESVGAIDVERIRFELRLAKTEFDALRDLADQRGEKSVQALAGAALRAFISKNPHYSATEMQVLGESNYQLLKVGTALNQMAKHMNANPTTATKGQELSIVASEIKAHVTLVSTYLRDSKERWVIEKV